MGLSVVKPEKLQRGCFILDDDPEKAPPAGEGPLLSTGDHHTSYQCRNIMTGLGNRRYPTSVFVSDGQEKQKVDQGVKASSAQELCPLGADPLQDGQGPF